MNNEFHFDLQQVVASDQVCVDGVCFVPPMNATTDPEDTSEE